jgi:hypothetical protein
MGIMMPGTGLAGECMGHIARPGRQSAGARKSAPDMCSQGSELDHLFDD